MKANELRIGNWVANSEPQFTPFIQIKELSPIGHGMYSWIKPIPLTEEWLLRFGFEYLGMDKVKMCDSYKLNKFKLSLSNYGNVYYGKTPIQYVHSIQNLYFALTGEELTLKS